MMRASAPLLAVALLGGCHQYQATTPTTAPAVVMTAASVPVAPKWRSIPLSDSRIIAREPRDVARLADLAATAARTASAEDGAGLVAANEVWVTVIDARDPHDPRIGSYQGNEGVYPASVVKLCYMVAAYDQLWTGCLSRDTALMDDLKTMITVSDNASTNRILDRISNTSYGPDLAPEAAESFFQKRQTATRYLQQLGLKDLWVVSKTYSDGIPLYGRDVQMLGDRRGDNFENSNMMSTEDTARLLYLIWKRSVVAPEACDEMLALMDRSSGENETPFSAVVPPGAKLFSKDGYALPALHDAGIIQLADGGAVILVVFTKVRHPADATERNRPPVVAGAARRVLEALLAEPGELDEATRDEVPGASLPQ